MSELVARARLFAAVEGGASLWSREVFSNGASYVLDRALTGAYDPIKYARTIEKLKLSNADELLQSIASGGCRGRIMVTLNSADAHCSGADQTSQNET